MHFCCFKGNVFVINDAVFCLDQEQDVVACCLGLEKSVVFIARFKNIHLPTSLKVFLLARLGQSQKQQARTNCVFELGYFPLFWTFGYRPCLVPLYCPLHYYSKKRR